MLSVRDRPTERGAKIPVLLLKQSHFIGIKSNSSSKLFVIQIQLFCINKAACGRIYPCSCMPYSLLLGLARVFHWVNLEVYLIAQVDYVLTL